MEFKINGMLTVENILRVINPIDIYKRYSSNFQKINSHFKSDFRVDPKPSAIVYYYNGTWLYNDFGGNGSMNCFQFVQLKLGLTFKEVLERINNDFSLCLGGSGFGNTKMSHKSIIIEPQSEFKTIITVKRREFKPHDLEWWGSQAWNEEMLNFAKISPIEYFRLTSERKGIDNMLYKCDDYSYNMDYYWHNGIFRRKLYFPKKEPLKKWLSNVDKTVVQGWDLLPKSGNILFITSSFKDCAPFYRIYGKWCAIAPNNEGSWLPDKVFYKLKSRYDKIYIYFDNDEAGIKAAKKYSAIYKIPYIHNPIGSPKDPTDFWRKYGGREFNYYLQRAINNET